MTSASERRQELIEEGHRATMVAAAIYETVNILIEDTVKAMVNHYRQGQINHDFLVGKVGEINALHTLMSNLENKQNRANLAAQQEYGNAPS